MIVFRSDEAAAGGLESVKNFLLPRSLPQARRAAGEQKLHELVAEIGPVVDGYPTWHPLVAKHDPRYPQTVPSDRTGYRALDHTRFFAHGFITCPYKNGEEVIRSALEQKCPPGVSISAERLDVEFYAEGAEPVLVRCHWDIDLEDNQTIPKAIAVPLMLEQELPAWRWAQRSETWETMRPYLLGAPHGNRSSLFVTQDTALALKKVYLALVDSGMFGVLHR
jgi:hypothetical protein